MVLASPIHARRPSAGAGASRIPTTRPVRAGGGLLPGALAAAGDEGSRIALMREVNGTAGNRAAAALAAGLQRQDDADGTDPTGVPAGGPDDDTAPFATKDRPFELSNTRFTPHKRLADIADRGDPLAKSDAAPVVKAIQTALLDTGYSLLRYHDDGSFGGETTDAIRQFRTDNGLAADGGLDWEALRALDATAPAPGVKQEHYLDYERLYGDGKLDVMLAIGYDEGQSQYDDLDRARAWLNKNKLKNDAPPAPAPALTPPSPGEPASGASGTPAPDPNEATKKGLSVPETWKGTKTVTYPDAKGDRITKDIAIKVTLVPPGTGAKAAYARGLNDNEISVYSGHARRGIGPDFDADKSAAENFIIGVGSALHAAGRVKAADSVAQSHYVIDKKNDLEAMKAAGTWDAEKYRVWFFNACTSIAYFDELRGGLLPDKMDSHNLDLFGTNASVPIAAGIEPVLANLEGILAAKTMEQIVVDMQTATIEAMREAAAKKGLTGAALDAAIAPYKKNMYERDGAGDNQVATP